MKKIYALCACALLSTPVVFGQRTIDLEVTIEAPVANTNITSGTQFNTRFVIKNVGTTTLKTSDSVIYGYLANNNLLDFNGGTQGTLFFRTGKQLAPTDTIIITNNLTLTFGASLNGNGTFGMVVDVLNRSADSAIDGTPANNIASNPVIWGGTNSVEGVQASIVEHKVVSVYPNPASGNINLKVSIGATTDVIVRAVDIMGRVVYTENKGKMAKGEHLLQIPLNGMTEGYYFYQVVIGNETFSDKFYVK